MMHRLFYSRLLIYLLAVSIPLLYPAVVVAYDRTGFITWFILIPGLMFIAFYLRPPRVKILTGPLLALAILFLFSLHFGWNLDGLFFILLGFVVYVLTLLIFSGGSRGISAAVLETFALAIIYYRLLDFSRASEETARAAQGWTAPLLVITVGAFLLHGLVIYLAAFPDRSPARRKKELLVFAGVTIPLCTLIAIALPSDFIRHKFVLNDFFEQPQMRELPPAEEGDSKREDSRGEKRPDEQGEKGEGEGRKKGSERGKEHNGLPLGGREFPEPSASGEDESDTPIGETRPDEHREGKGKGRDEDRRGETDRGRHEQGESGGRKKQGDKKGKRSPQLQGVPSDQWRPDMQSGESGQSKQMAVMIIASPIQPVYAAESYWNDFQAVNGFTIDPDFDLNRIRRARFLETWRNHRTNEDKGRRLFEIFFLSAIEDRTVPYFPQMIEPTRLQVRYHPFNLSYRDWSQINVSPSEEWKTLLPPDAPTRRKLGRYLKIDMAPEHRRSFETFLRQNVRANAGYFEKIEAILKSMSHYQYRLGFNEDTSVARLDDFLRNSKAGDCTEFSHVTAILGRLAGIPSRVVTGYVAARELQTQAHRRGLRELRKHIAPLRDFPMKDLYLVTTSHHHAWVQYYLPGYGWVDFESTAHAIPPKPKDNPNQMDVVIPLIEKEKNMLQQEERRKFSWLTLSVVLGALLTVFMLLLYLYRYGRETILYFRARGLGPQALEARYRLLLMRLAAGGYPLKEIHETPLEYSKRIPELSSLASLFTMLRFRERYQPGEREQFFSRLDTDRKSFYRRMSRPGPFNLLKRIFSLRGLHY